MRVKGSEFERPADTFNLHKEVALGPGFVAGAVDVACQHDDLLLVGRKNGVGDKGASHKIAKRAPAAASLDAVEAVEIHFAELDGSQIVAVRIATTLNAGITVVGTAGDMAFHDGVQTVEDVLLVKGALVLVGEDVNKHADAEVLGFLADPGKVVALFGNGKLVAEHQTKAELLADGLVDLEILHALEGFDYAAMLGTVYLIEDVMLILAQHVAQGGLVLNSKIEHHLGSGILVNMHVDLVGVVRIDIAIDDVAMIPEHLGVLVGGDGDVDNVKHLLRNREPYLGTGKERVDKFLGFTTINILIGNNHQLKSFA